MGSINKQHLIRNVLIVVTLVAACGFAAAYGDWVLAAGRDGAAAYGGWVLAAGRDGAAAYGDWVLAAGRDGAAADGGWVLAAGQAGASADGDWVLIAGADVVYAGELQESFAGYVHDPMENPDAAKDIVVNNDAVYGFSPDPDPDASLAVYADQDWTDPVVVEAFRKEREAYHDSMRELYQIIENMTAEGKDAEEIARVVCPRRNELRFEACGGDPEKIAKLKERNLEKYGNEDGPTPEWLFERYGTWEIAISKALQSNPGADACLGLYDEYYDTYFLNDGKKWSGDWNYYELNGRTYTRHDKLVSGMTVIDGAAYYFEDGIKVTGFVTIDGSRYYFDADGKMATGLTTIGGATYYFDKKGRMKTGAVKTGGKLYYFGKSGKGRAAKGWFKGIDGKKRYSLGKGRIAAGVKKVGGTYYFFKKDSGKLQGKGFFKSGKKEYYCTGGGVLATGWKAIGKKACYFYPDGVKACEMAKNTKVGYLKIPKSGRLGEAYALGVKALDKHGWTLRAAYRFSYKLKYYDRWYRRKTSELYALRGFKEHHGNCYVMAATFYIQAKLLGCDVHQVRGHVGVWPHSWTVIRHGKKYYVYDPNFRNETGRNGWKIWYGKRGTWRYSGKHWMN